MPATLAAIHPGRPIQTYPLLDDVQAWHIPDRAEAHAAIHAALAARIAEAGEAAVILERAPIGVLWDDYDPEGVDAESSGSRSRTRPSRRSGRPSRPSTPAWPPPW
ncbi:hypothetical protein ACFY0G_02170 [Streptomyces sp. NPDC001552]|uniref:hypothetical protein n=1 Tax=Streptomyces sp. NPDC001552 TaxID=3364587 RepID=UPI0036C2D9F7